MNQIKHKVGPPKRGKLRPSPYLFCDACGFYPIEPVHGHYTCPSCHLPTKCCEAGPIPAEWHTVHAK